MFICPFLSYEHDINEFELLKKINDGSFGSVYLAIEKKTRKNVAIKILKYIDNQDVWRIKTNRELEILIQTNHPAIIKIIGYCRKDFFGNDNLCIIMPLMMSSYHNILEDIQSGLPPPNFDNTSRQKIIYGIANALKRLHSKKIAHRDIKPGNVLIDQNYLAFLADFNLSKSFNPKLQIEISQNDIGTRPYMAPEIINGDENYDPFKADVYAFGIFLYQVVTDRQPYENFTFKTEYKIINENFRPKLYDYIPTNFSELLKRCFDKDPKKRPSFNEIVEMLNLPDYYLPDVNVDEYKSYIDDVNEAKDIFDSLYDENEELKKQVQKLIEQNNKITNERNNYDAEIIKLKKEIGELKSKQSESQNKKKKTKKMRSELISPRKREYEGTNDLAPTIKQKNSNDYHEENEYVTKLHNEIKKMQKEIDLLRYERNNLQYCYLSQITSSNEFENKVMALSNDIKQKNAENYKISIINKDYLRKINALRQKVTKYLKIFKSLNYKFDINSDNDINELLS
ncbi:hypothetical protein M9Y10_034409 [Tritrichomonas musculus]|uniref:Protein kinase domain-containing protein n=1 Tax=Tritrichomonas musculus TaxID=1915356 RepID=A0ABR2KFV7_9EUKA